MEDDEPLIRDKEDPSSATNTTDEIHNEEEKQTGQCIPKRYIMVLILVLGTANSFAVRVNFNVALLVMVNYTSDADVNNTLDYCPGNESPGNVTTNAGGGEYNWSPALQSSLLGAFYYGYPLTQPFAGWMAERFGSKKLLMAAGIAGGLLNLLMPLVASWNVYVLLLFRVLLGLAMGPVWPSLATVLARWAMHSERTRMYAACNAGLYMGTVISQSISGILCSTDFLGGWPSVFYLFGTLSLLWSLLVGLVMADTPAKHPSISRQEREMIEANTGDTKYLKPPYKSILTSVPIWAFFIMLFMDITAYDIIFTYLPLYMKRVLNYDIASSGVLSSIPYVISIIVSTTAGYTADLINNRGWLSRMWIRRIYTIGGDTLPSLCVLTITFLGCDRVLIVFFFILAVSLSGIGNGGFNVSMFDLAPRYAGSIYGVINGFSNMGGFIGPLVVGAITENSSNVTSWHAVFYIVVVMYNVGVITYCVFGSATLQPWAVVLDGKNKEQYDDDDSLLDDDDLNHSIEQNLHKRDIRPPSHCS